MRHQVQLEAEQKAAEAKRLAELKDEIFLKLRRILAEELAVDAEQVNLDSHLADDLGADGLDGLQLTIAIENEFEIEIPNDEAEKIGLFSHKSSNSSYNTNSSPNRLWLVSTSENFQPQNYHPPTCTVGELLDYIYQKINDTTKTK
ncbi:MAG: acyl carrier protein [Limnoraphis sp. WC205]|nr:acyl carrier protein [Limnoraphis sp. WC205]